MFKALKQGALLTARTARIFDRIADSRWRTERLLIIAYHGVAFDDEHLWDPALFFSAEVFRSRMQQIRDGGFNVLGLSEAVQRLASRTLPPRSVALTFDDGSADFYARAYPILKEFGFPATVYLTTYYCRHQSPVFDPMCSYLLWKGRTCALNLGGLVPFGRKVLLADVSERNRVVRALKRHTELERMSAEDKDTLATRIADRLNIDYASLRKRRVLHIMNESEILEIAKGGVAVQLHTHRHRTPRTREELTREIRDNRDEIARITRPGRDELVHFCYPSGVYNAALGDWLLEEQMRSATTCVPDLATPTTNPMFLPRLVDGSASTALSFQGWLCGVAKWLSKSRRTVEV